MWKPWPRWGCPPSNARRAYIPRGRPAVRGFRRGPGGLSLLGFGPGGPARHKRWPAERFAAVADRWLSERPNARAVLLGAATDIPAGAAVRAAMDRPVVDWVGRTSLAEMLRILNRAALVVTNDSGATHVAAALGRPTVAVFGPTVREFGFFPVGPRVAVVEGGPLPCRPCALHGKPRCPEGHFRCMTDIPVEHVLAAARVVAGEPRP
ncbi:MAG: glycosyltransferase family 9 protein [Elusimicrobia bacterium]|nr:glycosyltransferase family 9 protein [Elusimicrobiota bacterium]